VLIDFRELPDGAVLDADICVVGAGAAGITIARALARQGRDVLLLESGGAEPEAEIQELYAGESLGLDYPMEARRLRLLGGSTNHWQGQSLPLDPIDLEARPWVPYSGWPIPHAELLAHVPAAHDVLGLGPPMYEPGHLAGTDLAPDPFRPDRLRSRYFRIGTPPARLGEKYLGELRRAPGLRLVLHASVTRLGANAAASRVERALLADLSGRRGVARARVFVLACGGLENARILLLSDDVAPHGLANGSGMVGRFFMDHPNIAFADLLVADAEAVTRRYGPIPDGPSQLYHAAWLPEVAQRRERLLNVVATIDPHRSTRIKAVRSLRSLYYEMRDGRLPSRLGERLTAMAGDLTGVAAAVRGRIADGVWPSPGELPVFVRVEPTPDPESRVTLGRAVDALGLRRLRLDWRLGRLEFRTARAMLHELAVECGRLGIGRLRLRRWLRDDPPSWPTDLEPIGHNIGTTRMAESPAAGVVDRHCRCHEVDNLYIAGSSVFPTAGFTNPTLNLVALALRLADHLGSAVQA
jgi:choline dehydrogenase-like flavoprotein